MEKFHSLQTKLLIIVLVPVIIVSLLAIATVSYQRKQELTEQFSKIQTKNLLMHAEMIATPMWQLDRPTISSMLSKLAQHSDVISIEVIDETKEQLGFVKNTQKRNSGVIYLSQKIYHPDRHGALKEIGQFRVIFSESSIQAIVNTEILYLTALSLFIIFIQLFAVIAAFHLMLKSPLQKMITGIREAEMSGKSKPIALAVKDEFGIVTKAYNKMQAKLDANTVRLETIYNKSPGLLFSLDTQGKFASVSDFFCSTMNIERIYLLGLSILELFPELRPYVTHLQMGNSIEGVQINFNIHNVEEIRRFLLSSIPEYDASNIFVGSLCVMTDITEQIKHQQVIKHQAYYDALTGLPNRSLMMENLQGAIDRSLRSETKMAVLFLDLDRFKWVNDSYGHNTGDQLLQEVAKHLSSLIRIPDMVARFGGDEFIIILEGLQSSSDVHIPLRRILDTLSKPLITSNYNIFTTGSIGVAICPDHSTNPEVLLKHADSAMYEAKQTKDKAYSFYADELDVKVNYRIHIASQLMSAITENRLVLHFQPIVNVFSLETIGYEALIRMVDSTTGKLIPPDDFIPISEELGVIREIGDWVIKNVLVLLRDWPENLQHQPKPAFISVNVSYIQVFDANFHQRLTDLLADYNVAAERLVLELTESGLIEATGDKEKFIHQLINVGCPLSLDDFGTGYSSLSRLKDIPFKILKIDRSFVRGIENRGDEYDFAQVLTAIGKIFGMKIIVEGIETLNQSAIIKELYENYGSDVYAQGFFHGEPLAIGSSHHVH